jgi:hypothetical protein
MRYNLEVKITTKKSEAVIEENEIEVVLGEHYSYIEGKGLDDGSLDLDFMFDV